MSAQPGEGRSIPVSDVVRHAGKLLISAAGGLICFFGVRTVDRIETNQERLQQQNSKIMEELGGITTDIKYRDSADARVQHDMDDLKAQLRDFDRRVMTLERHR